MTVVMFLTNIHKLGVPVLQRSIAMVSYSPFTTNVRFALKVLPIMDVVMPVGNIAFIDYTT